jgi:hypothetical protein
MQADAQQSKTIQIPAAALTFFREIHKSHRIYFRLFSARLIRLEEVVLVNDGYQHFLQPEKFNGLGI